MQLPITIGLHRSRLLAAALLTSLTGVVLALLAWPGDPWWRGSLLLLAGGLGRAGWRQLRPALAALRLLPDGGLEVRLSAQADFVAVELLPGAGVHPWLSVARLRLPDGRRVAVLVTVDSMAAEDFRRWRVFLRWRAQFSGGADAA